MEIVLLVIIFLALIAGTVIFFYRLSKKLSLKGYNSPIYQGLMIGLGMITSLSGIFFTDDYDFVNASTYVIMIIFPVLISFFAWLIVLMIPEGDKRQFGARKTLVNWKLLGILSIIALIIVVILIFLVEEIYVRHLVKSISLLLAAMGYCFYMQKRSEIPDAETVLATDKRAPVLFLRAFKNEDFTFAELDQAEANEQGIGEIDNRPITFERFMSPFTNQNIGPFIALGSPEDYLPKDGAYRVYATDKNWKQYVKKWTKSATAIYMPIDNSENLGWELEYLKKSKLCHKLLVFTKPPMSDSKSSRIARKINQFIESETEVTWGEFKAVLEKYGYVLPKKEPKPGATIAFDENGVGVLVKEGSRSAAEYLSSSFTFQ